MSDDRWWCRDVTEAIVCVLGSIEIRRGDERVALTSASQRRILAALSVNGGRTVRSERLGEMVGASKSGLRTTVSRVRKAVGPDIVVTEGIGYRLGVATDADTFDRLVHDASVGDELGRLTHALALWRGPAFDEFAHEAWAMARAARLNELRCAAIEDRAAALVRSGEAAHAIADLEAHITADPYRDRPRGLLMEALAVEGRQADALRAYHAYRTFLREEVGTEPSPAVVAIEERIAAGWSLTDGGDAARTTGGVVRPTGTVTFLLTDIVGSTRLWEQNSRSMRQALETHDVVLRGAVERHRGVIFATGGDSFAMAFHSPHDGIACAVESQTELLDTAWPDGMNLRVRMALHRGEAHERDGHYLGPAVKRASQIISVTHGGEVLVSNEIAAVAEVDTTSLTARTRSDGSVESDIAAVAAPGLAPAASASRSVSPPPVDRERRQLTVAFFEFAPDSTQDPEDTIDPTQRRLTDAVVTIKAAGGHVASAVAPTVLAYFGYPVAQEDSARRALAAAEQIVSGSRTTPVRVRAGVHTGLAVIDANAEAGPRILGHTLSITATIQHHAPWGAVLTSGQALRIAGHGIASTPAGDARTSVDDDTVDLHRVTGPVTGRGRAVRTADPFVGRSVEIALLHERMQAALDGHGHVVTVMGEAGIGKSRLIAEFASARAKDLTFVSAGASPLSPDQPFGALADLLAGYYGWTIETPLRQRRADLLTTVGDEKITHTLDRLIAASADEVPAAPTEETNIADAVTSWLFAVADARPIAIVIEDLHWVDASTLTVLERLAASVEGAPVLLLLTTRPELGVPWLTAPNHTLLRPPPLGLDDVRSLLAQRMPGTDPHDGLIDELAQRSDGIPLFAQELASMAADSKGAPIAVPATLRDLLATRLDRVGHSRPIAQLASVIGRDFRADLLSTISGESVSRVEGLLASLILEEVIRMRAGPGDHRYEFRHELVRQAAYESLLRGNRQDLHRRIAHALEDDAFAEAATLAHHWEQALDDLRAWPAWERAADAALAKAAPLTAARFFANALRSLERAGLPKADDEVRLLLGQIGATALGSGWLSPELHPLLDRVRERSMACQDSNLVYEALDRLSFSAMAGGQVHAAIRLAEDLEAHAIEHHNRATLPRARVSLAGALMNAGRLHEAIANAEAALDATDTEGASLLGPMEICLAGTYGAMSAMFVADDPAAAKIPWVGPLQMFADGDDLFAKMFAEMALTIIADQERDFEATARHAAELIATASDFGIPTVQAIGTCYLGHARARQGANDGLTQQLEGLDAMHEQGMRIGHIGWWADRAEVLLESGDVAEARAAIDHAGSDERFFEQRLYVPSYWRMRARIAKAEGADPADVRACYAEAIEIATSCGMVNWLDLIQPEAAATGCVTRN